MPKKKSETGEAVATESVEVPLKATPKAKVIKMNVYDFATSFVQRRKNVEAAGAFIVLCEQEKRTVATRAEFDKRFEEFLAAPAR